MIKYKEGALQGHSRLLLVSPSNEFPSKDKAAVFPEKKRKRKRKKERSKGKKCVGKSDEVRRKDRAWK